MPTQFSFYIVLYREAVKDHILTIKELISFQPQYNKNIIRAEKIFSFVTDSPIDSMILVNVLIQIESDVKKFIFYRYARKILSSSPFLYLLLLPDIAVTVI